MKGQGGLGGGDGPDFGADGNDASDDDEEEDDLPPLEADKQ